LANLEEIGEAVEAARHAGCDQLILLHCVTSYPAPPEDSNLMTISHMGETFNVTVGLSDHTLGTATSVAAVALGASVIEKHVTLNRADGGPDAGFSLEPDELKSLCDDCQTA
jgi:N-acetylneuraminate synthase